MFILVTIIAYTLCIAFYGFFNCHHIDNADALITQMNIAYIAVSVIYLFLVRRKNLLCPEFFMALTFYTGTYLIAFSDVLDFRSIYQFSGYIVLQTISLATIGWMFFIIGALLAKNRKYPKTRVIYTPSNQISNATQNRNIFLVLMIISIAWMMVIDSNYLLNKYNAAVSGAASGMIFYVVIFVIATSYYEFTRLKLLGVNNFYKLIKSINKVYLAFFIFVSTLTFVLFGDRSTAVQMIIPFFILYYMFINRIKAITIIALLACGIFMALFVKDSRQGGSVSISDSFNLSNMVADFVPINAATPTLIQYTDMHGCTMGSNMLDQILAVVPFLQGAVLDDNTNLSQKSSIVNSVELLGTNFHSGQGTNVVGDLYYSFNMWGVVFGMLLAGYVFTYLFNKVMTDNSASRYSIIALLILFGNIVYFTRVEYTFILRTLSFTILIMYIVNRFFVNSNAAKTYNHNS